MFCCREIELLLSAGLNVILNMKNFYYNFPLIYTFNAHLSETNATEKVLQL